MFGAKSLLAIGNLLAVFAISIMWVNIASAAPSGNVDITPSDAGARLEPDAYGIDPIITGPKAGSVIAFSPSGFSGPASTTKIGCRRCSMTDIVMDGVIKPVAPGHRDYQPYPGD